MSVFWVFFFQKASVLVLLIFVGEQGQKVVVVVVFLAEKSFCGICWLNSVERYIQKVEFAPKMENVTIFCEGFIHVNWQTPDF